MPEPDCKQQLAQATETISHSLNEQRNAVHRSLYDRSKNQPLLRLRTHAAGDRALASHGQRGAARGERTVARAHDRCRPRPIAGRSQGRLLMGTEAALWAAYRLRY